MNAHALPPLTADEAARCADRDGYGIHSFISGPEGARRLMWQVHRVIESVPAVPATPGASVASIAPTASRSVGRAWGSLEGAEAEADDRREGKRIEAALREVSDAASEAARVMRREMVVK